jgi:hypothetical protein
MRSAMTIRTFPSLTVCVLGLALGLGGCSSTGSGSGEGTGSTLKNFLLYGGATVPPAAPPEIIEVRDCPAVTVSDGGAALRTVAGSGDAASVRSQLSITEVARECSGRPDGAVIVKVGVQVRALIGPGGGSGRFDAPVNIVLKRGDQILASRARRVAITVAPGQFEQSAIVVEDNLVAPPGPGEFDIEVGLGAGPRAPRAERRARGSRG